MNIYDVSKKAGVSIATVSRVLNGNPNVSEKTKEKVQEAINELSYTPNVFARGLGLNTMNTIGIMCADSSDPFLANAVFYLEQELRKHGYDSFLCCTGYKLEQKEKYLSFLLSKRVDAIIIVGSSLLEAKKKDNKYLIDASNHVPIMLMNGYLASPNIFCTLCDDYEATYSSTLLLRKQGFRKILYLYHSKSYSGLQKINGFKSAIASLGDVVSEDYIRYCPKDILLTKDLLFELDSQGLSFDAVLAAEDIYAIAALKYAKAKNYRIPKEFSIIGYNNSMLSLCCDPELSTIDNHVETLSITTVNSLMRVLSGSVIPNKTSLSNDLIHRGTTIHN